MELFSQYGFKLYLRNASSLFYSGFFYPTNEAFLIVSLLHLVFLPLTLTLGAGIKTLIDLLTRKPLSPDESQDTELRIQALDVNEDTVEDISKKLIDENTSAQSDASKDLLFMLGQAKETFVENTKHEIKLRLSKASRLMDQEQTGFLTHQAVAVGSKLSQEERGVIISKYLSSDEYKKQRMAMHTLQKLRLARYFQNEYNMGTTTQRSIHQVLTETPDKTPAIDYSTVSAERNDDSLATVCETQNQTSIKTTFESLLQSRRYSGSYFDMPFTHYVQALIASHDSAHLEKLVEKRHFTDHKDYAHLIEAVTLKAVAGTLPNGRRSCGFFAQKTPDEIEDLAQQARNIGGYNQPLKELLDIAAASTSP